MRYLSLFSGIEAATVAWHPLGWECVAVAEIDKFPCALLAHKYPDVPNLGDVSKVTAEDIRALGPIDLVVFGSPCQDLSVAGKRKGLAGARSGLFHVALDIVDWAREHCGARWALWENVPGAFTSQQGRDFATVVEELAGLSECPVPPKGWGNEGAAIGEKAMVEWSTLDAQWFGVAQRRRRVFALADFGDWTRRSPVLLEPSSLSGDTAPRRGAGESVAPTLDVRAGRSGETTFHTSGELAISPNMAVRSQIGARVMATHEVVGTLCAENSPHGARGLTGLQTMLSGYIQPVIQRIIALDTTQITSPQNGSNPKLGDPCHPLTAKGHVPAIAFQERGRTGGRSLEINGDLAYAMTAPNGGNQGGDVVVQPIAFDTTQITSPQNGSNPKPGDPCHPITAKGHAPAVSLASAVRRLTPTECERLQGFPDSYTDIPWRGNANAPDGPRYKALGNSMAVPCMRWIGEQV